MAKYGEGDRVALHPNVTGQHVKYEGRIGVVLSIEADVLHHHLGGVAQYRVEIEDENPAVSVSVSEKELRRARRTPENS
jgi:hypothetical protein|tara:strand:+ start:424 stop:660 length:237 start_codon:yes stop_codon:yes gene_type:complete